MLCFGREELAVSDGDSFTVTCPCCGALLTIDGASRVVCDHQPPPDQHEKTSFEARLKTLDEEKRAAEEKFKESVRSEKGKKDILEKKFKDLFEKAKEGPQGPFKRDIDLD